MAAQILAMEAKKMDSVFVLFHIESIFFLYQAWLVKTVAGEQQELQQKVRNIKKED